MKKKRMTAEELDRRFDAGEDIMKYMDPSSARRSGMDPKCLNVDFPQWMVFRLDREARNLGVTRESLIKTWIGDRINTEDTSESAPSAGPDQ